MPVVFLTTTGRSEELPGSAELLRKPVAPNALLDAVRRRVR